MAIRRVYLKIGSGSFSTGFPVIAQIGAVGELPHTEMQGRLPTSDTLPDTLINWRASYLQLVNPHNSREIHFHPTQRTNVSYREESRTLATVINQWLEQPEPTWQKIRDRLQQELNPDDEIQLLVQTDDPLLLQLPWSAWRLFTDDYPQAEIALGPSDYKQVYGKPPVSDSIRILVVLGYSNHLNLQADQTILQNLTMQGADPPTVLSQPTPSELRQALRDPEGWHIFCYAGHSQSRHDGSIGELQLQSDQLISIQDLKASLQKAIAQGLQLAIFNSCDGLGLARQLAALNLPQSVVMREPIPDHIAPEFLKIFLQEYAQGQSLYLSLREAREHLEEAWRENYPGVEWLPVLTQNPAMPSPRWSDLGASPVSPCPYQGLAAFQEADADRFFGRDLVIHRLLEQLEQQILVTVLGPSGSGKSSVVLAGLLPQYRLVHSDTPLNVAMIKPGSTPCDALAMAMVTLANEETSDTDHQYHQLRTAIALEQDPQTLSQALTRLTQLNPKRRFLLIVDQLEELFTLCQDRSQQQAFFDNVITAIREAPGFKVVVTLRLDFLEQARSHDGFNQILQIFPPELLGPMTPFELEAAIAEPAALRNVSFQPGLVERLVQEMKNQPQRLPLLEFALTQLWDRLVDQTLTHDAYQEIGGIDQALANYAEDCFAQVEERDRPQAQHIFTQLVMPGDTSPDARRRATPEDMGAEHWPLVAHFATQRLLVTSYQATQQMETAEIIHETLITHWPRLTLWLAEDREFRLWQEQLRSHYRLWLKTERDQEALLSGTLLTMAQSWEQQRPNQLSSQEQQFIQLSLERRDRLQQSLEKTQRKTKHLNVIAVALGLGALMVGGIAWQQWQQTQQRQLIQQARQGTLSKSELPQLADVLTQKLAQAQSIEAPANSSRNLSVHREVQQVAQRVQADFSTSETPAYVELEQTAAQSLLKLIRKHRIPKLQQQLQQQVWGQILDAIPEKKHQQFSPGAIQTTYQLLLSNEGMGADVSGDGLLAQPEEAQLIPCDAIALLEKLWRKATEGRCGWYGPQSIFENPNCPELSFIGTDIQTDPLTGQTQTQSQTDGGTLLYALIPFPTDAMVNRIRQCDVIAQPPPQETEDVSTPL